MYIIEFSIISAVHDPVIIIYFAKIEFSIMPKKYQIWLMEVRKRFWL